VSSSPFKPRTPPSPSTSLTIVQLTLLGFNLLYSQLAQIFPSKHVVMLAICIFELGSLICGVAPSMDVLIFGRALAGVGAAGIFSGAMLIIAEITTLHERPKFFGLFGVWCVFSPSFRWS